MHRPTDEHPINDISSIFSGTKSATSLTLIPNLHVTIESRQTIELADVKSLRGRLFVAVKEVKTQWM
jgi:hypothetical protein